MRDSLDRQGFVRIPGLLSAAQLQRYRAQIDAQRYPDSEGARVGGRNINLDGLDWRSVFDSPRLAEALGSSVPGRFGIVRALFFDKPPGRSWRLALHRDRTIAVAAHRALLAPYSHPTLKAGVPHVVADPPLLERMVTLRLHLDAMHEDNGPLQVVPGSHRCADPTAPIAAQTPVEIHCAAGDGLLMKPLLLHGSRSPAPGCTAHRRVLHLECAPENAIANGYAWHRFEPISAP